MSIFRPLSGRQTTPGPKPPRFSASEYHVVSFGFGRAPDAFDIAELHSELLPASPISKLGSPFMERFYYSVLPREGLIFGAVAYVRGKPAGFVSATADAEGFMGHGVRRAFPQLIYAVASSVLHSPNMALRGIWEALNLMQKRGSGPSVGEILSLGVRAEFRGADFRERTGVSLASELADLVTANLRKAGVRRARVIIDDDNAPAQRFYQRRGWRRTHDTVPGWTIPSIEMAIDL